MNEEILNNISLPEGYRKLFIVKDDYYHVVIAESNEMIGLFKWNGKNNKEFQGETLYRKLYTLQDLKRDHDQKTTVLPKE